jgi:hypothetical protein
MKSFLIYAGVVVVLVLSTAIYTYLRRAYLARKESSLKQSAKDLAHKTADKIVNTVRDTEGKV